MNNSNLNYLDELVKEYLIFRGFTQTNHYFSLEKKGDKLKGFQVDRILEQINIYISTYDINHLVELWNFLDVTFFSKIDYNKSNSGGGGGPPYSSGGIVNNSINSNSYTSYRNSNNDLASTIKKLSSSLRKYYVIYAINNNKIDKVKEFFDIYSLELLKDPEWQNWFALPYIRNPHLDPLFEIYFTKTWSEAFSLSLRNFLSTIFKNIPLPKILQFNLERQNRKRLETQLELLITQNEELRSYVDKLEYQNKRDQSSSSTNSNSGNNNSTGFTMGNLNSSSILRKENSFSNNNNNNNNNVNNNDLSSSNDFNSFARVSKRFEPRSSSHSNIAGLNDDDGYGGNDQTIKPMIGIGRSRKSISTVNPPNTTTNTTTSNTVPITTPTPTTTGTTPTTTTTNVTISPTSSLNNNNNSNLVGFERLNESGYEMAEMDENGIKKSGGINKSGGLENSLGSEISGSGGEIMYNIESQEICTSHSTAITRCKFLSNGSKIASSSIDGTVRLWNVGFNSRQTTIYCLSDVVSLEWENRSKLLLCGTTDSKIKIWNSLTDKAIGDINTSSEFPRVEDISCNPNGNSFATSSTNNARTDGVVYTWNLRTLKTEEKLSHANSNTVINSMSFNSTGTLLSTGCVDGTIRIFDIKSGSSIAGWQAHSNEILSVQFCSEDNRLYSLGKDGKLLQWNIHSMGGKPVREYEHPGFLNDPHRTTKISFNSDQSSFVVGTNNKFALLYNIDQSSPILQISGHTGPVITADWHPTQNVIVTGGLDQTVRLTKLSKSLNL